MVSSARAVFVDTFIASEYIFTELEKARRLIVIDDFLRRTWSNGLIIDWTLDAETWRQSVGEKSLFGIKYLITRKAFSSNTWNPSRQKNTDPVVVGTIFGGSDCLDLTSSLFEVSCESIRLCHFGTSNYPSYQKHRETSDFHWDLNEAALAKKLCQCDVVITAGGQILYELASMGVPSICVSTVDNQDEDFDRFVARGLSRPISLSDIKTGGVVDHMLALTEDVLLDMNKRCKAMFGCQSMLASEVRSYLCM